MALRSRHLRVPTFAVAVLALVIVTGCKRSPSQSDAPSGALVVTLHAKDGPLRDQLVNQRTAAGTRTFLVMTTAKWCPPCKDFEAHMNDPEVRAPLANATLVRFELEEFPSSQLTASGYSPSSVPWMMKVGPDLRPVDAIADEWDAPTGASIGRVISSFIAGTLTTRKYDWKKGHGFPGQ